VSWLLEAQHADGSRGFVGGTAEETGCAMPTFLATPKWVDLAVWDAVSAGAVYLSARFDDTDYPELWIGKGLYTPYAIDRSVIISALQWYRRGPRWDVRS
jgi:hypothetical protein